MSLDKAFQSTLEPLIERVEAAATGVAERADLIRRVDASGLPPDQAAFTVKELSKLLQLDPETVRQYFRAGNLTGLQLGNRILIWRWSVLEFMGLEPVGKKKAHPTRRA